MIFSKDLMRRRPFFGLLLQTADCVRKIWKLEKKINHYCNTNGEQLENVATLIMF